MSREYRRRAEGMVRVAVDFQGGSVIMDVPFWQSDDSIVRDAMERLGPLAAFVKNATVKRGEFF